MCFQKRLAGWQDMVMSSSHRIDIDIILTVLLVPYVNAVTVNKLTTKSCYTVVIDL